MLGMDYYYFVMDIYYDYLCMERERRVLYWKGDDLWVEIREWLKLFLVKLIILGVYKVWGKDESNLI